ncbi:MAG: phosphatidylserine decarboxylase family protein [Bryobacterales bacterium]|nr:phosphatidylserine decarboxylase family protein [Bryobacterales bacterium]
MRMVRTGIYYALALVAGGVIVSYLTRPIYSTPLIIVALFCLWFFRDPERLAPEGPHAVSPADGKVVAVKPEGGVTRVSIFLSPLDVHVNRSPIGGQIVRFDYKPGQFLVASREEASEQNEQNVITVRSADGVELTFKQIAGLVARRVIFYKKPGEAVRMGERIGLMQFGSRMDVLFGPEWEVTAKVGERVWAATTVIARRRPA